jgi:hypothetical protein
MADWNETAPLDNSVVSQFPANERAARAAVKTNFGIDHHDDVDSSLGFHEQVTLIERGSDPSAVANIGTLYTKDVSGATEVFYRDASGNISQLTKSGRVVGQQKAVLKTSNYTAVAGDTILVDKTSGNVTITLPASPTLGDEPISITHVAGSSNTLTIAGNGTLIFAAGDRALALAESLVLVYSGLANPGWVALSYLQTT